MGVIGGIDINLLSILIILVLFIFSRTRDDKSQTEYRLFIVLLCGTIVQLVADSFMIALDGITGPAARLVTNVMGAVYYIGHPVVPMFYAFYVEERLALDSRRPRAWKCIYAAPALASALLSASSPWTKVFFYYDAANLYHRGSLFALAAGLSYCYLLSAYYFIARAAGRKVIPRSTLNVLLAFPLPPIIAGTLQAAFYGLVALWPSVALSLLVIFIDMTNRTLSSDYLTGAFNRRRLDEYLEARVRELGEDRSSAGRRSRTFAGFLVDLDDFKQINDNYGHAVGDEALVTTVHIIKSCLRSDDFLARFAGDEFIAILPLSCEAELEQVVARLRSRFAESSLPRAGGRKLSLSVGAAVYDRAIDSDGDKYIARLDGLMYREKVLKKATKGYQ